jgi:hypothetical protein
MQKLSPVEHPKTEGNTHIILLPKSLKRSANNEPENTIWDYAAQFQKHLEEDGKSSKTIESYIGV